VNQTFVRKIFMLDSQKFSSNKVQMVIRHIVRFFTNRMFTMFSNFFINYQRDKIANKKKLKIFTGDFNVLKVNLHIKKRFVS